MYSEKPIKDYLAELASKSPVPGGGSVAALISGTAAALLGKVANFTVGKERYKAVEPEMTEVLSRMEGLVRDCNKLCSEDAVAYKKLSEAFKLPKEDASRKERVQEALKEAIAVPFEICRKAHEGAKLCLPVAEKGNPNLMTDTGIASLMFECAFQSALLNVEINLGSIKDEGFILETRKVLEPLGMEMARITGEVKGKVERVLKKR